MRSWIRLGGFVLTLCLWHAPREVQAAGTHFVLELSSGVAESAYQAQDVGLAYGASFGFTWKWKNLPVRFALLGNVLGRNAVAEGRHEGLSSSVQRRDVDVYVSHRIGFPLWSAVRLYGDVGLGQRFYTQTLRRAGFQELKSSSAEFLLVFGVGLQARISENFSIGVRGEVTPISGDPDLAAFAADFQPTRSRTALLAQVGIHF